MTEDRKYHVLLIAADGTKRAEVTLPVLPRFIHHGNENIVLSDEPEPPADLDEFGTILSFARIGSAVRVDDVRDALFLEVPTA